MAKRHPRFTASPEQKAETARSKEPQRLSNSSAMDTAVTAKVSEAPAKTSSPRKTEIAGSRSFEASHQKEPKLTAMLKSTWHVLKKPFKF
jgi:hypothetical protein